MHDVALDHLVIGATTLDAGIAWASAKLGIDVPLGGKHESMGTHNAIIAIDGGDLGADIYLEIIAIDPLAAKPARPRWFGLDNPDLQRQLKQEGPRPLTWVVRTDNLAAVIARSSAGRSPVELGRNTPMSRGGLHWQIAIPDDGQLIFGGLMPMVIQWPAGEHVSRRMAKSALKLRQIRLISDDPGRLNDALGTIGAQRLATVDQTPPNMPARIVVELIDVQGKTLTIGSLIHTEQGPT
jgi:Glyoxalase-like domain